MSSLASTRRQLNSALTLQSVVTTMKTLSSVRIGQYRRSVAALEASAQTIELALQAVLKMNPELLETPEPGARESMAVVVFGSDRGLCGPFNERIARHAAALLAMQQPGGEPPRVLAVGRRLEPRLRTLRLQPHERTEPPGSVGAIDHAVVEVLAHIDRWREEGRADRLFLTYNLPTGGATYESRTIQLLPLSTDWLRELRDRPWPSRRLPMELTHPRELLQGLVRQSIAHELVRAFAASQASENAARLAAMDAAERNIEERLETLQTAYRQARQNAVTAELLDIQAAYAARESDS